MPTNIHYSFYHLRRTFNTLSLVLGKIPSDQEMALTMGMTLDKFMELNMLYRNQYPKELDACDDEGSVISTDFTPDGHAASPQWVFEQKEKHRILYESLQRLSERDQQILIWRFGLGGEDPYSQKEVALKLGIPKRKVAQLEQHALQSLRVMNLDDLQDFL